MSSPLAFFASLLIFGLGFPLLQDAQPQNAQPQNVQQPAPAAPSSAPAAAAAPIPKDVASQVNPVKPTAASQARAMQIYSYDCEMCHGKGGDGVSEIDPNTKMRDYRDPASLKGLSDGEIFYIIQNGRGKMEGEGSRAKSDEIWNLVIYLRSLSKGKDLGSLSKGKS